MESAYIVAISRTPMGSFGGSLSSLSATQLGSIAIKGAIEKANIDPKLIEEVFFGNVCSANLGQAPARQASLGAGIGYNVPCTTVNKVCASGMKSIMFAAQSIQLGISDVVIAGGMESMSNIPYYAPNMRWGMKYGGGQLIDGLQNDGLMDAYAKQPMGVFGDHTAKKYNITREEQDAFTIESYTRAANATTNGNFNNEITPVSIAQKKGDPIIIKEDEEYKKVDFSKIPGLRPVFSPDGTVTAANASTMNDGASALLIVSERKLKELGLTPLARIVSFADAEQEPEWFTTTPTIAAPKAIKNGGLTKDQINFYEVNEAFAVVTLAFNKVLEVNPNQVNINGGAVSLGHPLGSSGSRIVCTLTNVLQQQQGKYGLATLCNGGGGASAIVIERV